MLALRAATALGLGQPAVALAGEHDGPAPRDGGKVRQSVAQDGVGGERGRHVVLSGREVEGPTGQDHGPRPAPVTDRPGHLASSQAGSGRGDRREAEVGKDQNPGT